MFKPKWNISEISSAVVSLSSSPAKVYALEENNPHDTDPA